MSPDSMRRLKLAFKSDMTREIRKTALVNLKSSFKSQYSKGHLGKAALQRLVEAGEAAMDEIEDK